MLFADGKGSHAGRVCRHDFVIRISPAHHGAISLDRIRRHRAGRDRHDPVQAGRHGGLTLPIIAPSHDRAIRLQGQTVSEASRNRHHVTETCRHLCLTIILAGITAPGHHGAVGLQRHGMVVPCCDSLHAREASGHV